MSVVKIQVFAVKFYGIRIRKNLRINLLNREKHLKSHSINKEFQEKGLKSLKKHYLCIRKFKTYREIG
jgi:hypothetical protein